MDKKEIKNIILNDIRPLFVGLRNELKDVKKKIDLLTAKKPPEIQKVNVENETKEVEVKNLPQTQKVEILNHPEKQDLSFIDKLVASLGGTIQLGFKTSVAGMTEIKNAVNLGIDSLKKNIFKVEITNKQELPEVIKVEEVNKQEIPNSVSIKNKEPNEAIPVRLTTKDGQKFYNAIAQLVGLSDINLSDVKKKLDSIIENTADISIDADSINLNVDELEILLGKILVENFGEANVAPSTENALASIIVPVGKKIRIKGVNAEGDDDGIFRLYVNSTKKWQGRNSWSNRSISDILEIEAIAGDTITLKVFNTKGTSKNYSGTIYGYQF